MTGCCRGCTGDYEDPDRTAWEEELEEGQEVNEAEGELERDRRGERFEGSGEGMSEESRK